MLHGTGGNVAHQVDCTETGPKGVGDMEDISLTYSFTLEDGSQEVFELTLDAVTLELKSGPPADLPPWTELGFHQCPSCPLESDTTPHCPAAAHLVGLIQGFARVLSHEKVRVEVVTENRTIISERAAQEAISSLMGLIMAVSGCPHTSFFRPMARFHLPFATEVETAYRAASMYLLAQYFAQRAGKDSDPELEGLLNIYKQVRDVNGAFVERLRAATEADSAINAIVVLDMLALNLPMAIGNSLEQLRHLFEPFLDDTEEAT